MITAELISIGDELLIGQTINTNASWLGQQFALAGIRVMHVATISDDKSDIVSAFDAAFKRNDIIIVTGGLGPTKDDITKHVLCDYFDTTLEMNQEVLAHIEGFFKSRNRPMLEVNTQQAALPKACQVLFNRQGTAAGMWFEKDGKVLISMPGVPYEMKSIFLEEALPKIKAQFATVDLYHRTILTQGIGESFLADQLSDWEDRIRANGLSLAYLPSPGLVKLRITSFKGVSDEKLVQSFINEIKERLPKHVFAEGERSIASVVGEILVNRKQTIGTVESCTSGAIAATIASVPGASDYFHGSFVTYSYELKEQLAHVKHETLLTFGAVSEETVVEMATGGRRNLNVDWCIAVSGIAGPGGGMPDKPVGTVWIAIAGPEHVFRKCFHFGDNRERNIQMTILTALNCLRCELLQLNN